MILDPTCSAKSIWFDKNNKNVVHCDIRVSREYVGLGKNGRWWDIRPDVRMNFIAMPFPCEFFEMVVFDPPHLKDIGMTSYTAKKYGKLFTNWRDEIKNGFSECFRVLRTDGFLIFKWSEQQIPLNDVLALSEYYPLFGHTTGSKSTTKWICFRKES